MRDLRLVNWRPHERAEHEAHYVLVVTVHCAADETCVAISKPRGVEGLTSLGNSRGLCAAHLTEKFEGKIWVNFVSFVMQMEKQCDLPTKKCGHTTTGRYAIEKKWDFSAQATIRICCGYIQLNWNCKIPILGWECKNWKCPIIFVPNRHPRPA